MNTEVEPGQNCEAEVRVNGDVKKELTSPETRTLTMYSGENVASIWQEVVPFVRKAAYWGRGEYLAEDVMVLAALGKMQIWVFRDNDMPVLVCVTEILTYPRRKICNIYALAGSRMSEMWGFFSHMGRAWLVQNGVEEVQTTCRAEVAEKIKPFGFEPLVQVLRLTAKEQS